MTRKDNGRMPGPEELAFLRLLDPKRREARTRQDVPGGSEQSVNALRQKCTRNGWTRFARDAAGTTGWLLTAAGARAVGGDAGD